MRSTCQTRARLQREQKETTGVDMGDALDAFIAMEGPLRKVKVACGSAGATLRELVTRIL